jgi:hypothetical protein
MFLILVFLLLICVGVSVWAITDIASRPASAFVSSGASKITWLVLIVAACVVFAPVALVLSIVYLWSIRPKLARVA